MTRMFLPLAMLTIAAAPAERPVERQIMAAMAASAAGWNTGDLDRFMAVYGQDAVYVTKRGLLRSKARIAAQYRPSFVAGANRRGTLGFQPLYFRRIDPRHQLLIARWTLTPADKSAKPDTGMTTLLFERQPAGWHIVSDHSS